MATNLTTVPAARRTWVWIGFPWILVFFPPWAKRTVSPHRDYREHSLSLHPFKAQVCGKKFILNPFFLWQLWGSLRLERPRHYSVPRLSGRCRAVSLRGGGLLGRLRPRWREGNTLQRVCWGKQWDFHPMWSHAWASRFLLFLSPLPQLHLYANHT